MAYGESDLDAALLEVRGRGRVGGKGVLNKALSIKLIFRKLRSSCLATTTSGPSPPSLPQVVQPVAPEEDLWNKNVETVDTFTLVHHDLCASTNSLQYSMVGGVSNKKI